MSGRAWEWDRGADEGCRGDQAEMTVDRFGEVKELEVALFFSCCR